MKKINVFFLFVVATLFVSASVFATGIHRGFENCQITALDDLIINKKIEKVWKLNYNPDEKSITVMKKKSMNGPEYIVRTSYFEICYAATEEGFGVRKLKPSERCVPAKICSAVLDARELERQRIITPGKVNDETAIGLIASYLPDLLNDEYTHILN